MKLTPQQLKAMLAEDPKLLLVDVRTRDEFNEGHIPGAGCFPVEELCDLLYDEALAEGGLDAIAQTKGMQCCDDATAIVVYCRSGVRSARAATHLEALGYENIYDAGGILSWPYDIERS